MTAPTNTAVVACFFGVQPYDTPARNVRRFLRNMTHLGVPVFGLEASTQAAQLNIPGWPRARLNNRTLLWQKEALWNQVVRTLPPEFTKVICLDADIWFSNPNWLSETAQKLDEVKVVVPFTRALWPDRRGVVVRERESSWHTHKTSKQPHKGHPGFAFAARRELWSLGGGLFPFCPTGRGDVILWHALLGGKDTDPVVTCGLGETESVISRYSSWALRLRNWCAESIDGVDGDCVHEWHGDLGDRNYTGRHTAIKGMQADALAVRTDGLVTWTDQADLDMMYHVKQYFSARKEDG